MYIYIYIYIYIYRERERQRQRLKDKGRDRHKERDTRQRRRVRETDILRIWLIDCRGWKSARQASRLEMKGTVDVAILNLKACGE